MKGIPTVLQPIMTHDEIAKVLGISRQLVQLIEYRALRKLRLSPILRELNKCG